MDRVDHFKVARDLLSAREALRRLLEKLGDDAEEVKLALSALGIKWYLLREEYDDAYPGTTSPYLELW